MNSLRTVFVDWQIANECEHVIVYQYPEVPKVYETKMDLVKQQRYVMRDTQQDEVKDTKYIPKHEFIAEQHRIIKNWKPQSDVWPWTIGRNILIGATAITSIYINHRFRARLKLRDYGVFPTMLGLTITPVALTTIAHTQFITNKLLLLEIPCPLCIEAKAAMIQTGSAVFLPLILAPLANFSAAAGSGVFNVPYITDVRVIFKTIKLAYQPMIPTIGMIYVLHLLLASFITYSEIKSYLRVLDIQYLIEEEKEQKIK